MSGRWKIVMAVTLALALAGHWGWRLLVRASPLHEERYLASIFPEADEFSAKEGSPPRYTAFRKAPGGKRLAIGVAYLTSDILPQERGYAGPIHILVGLKNDGAIAAIRVIGHQETPSYARVIDEPSYWERFAGKKPADAFVLDHDVDSISRATITAEGVARAIRDSSRIVAREVLRLPVPPPAGGGAAIPWRRVILVAVGAAGALASFLFPRAPLQDLVLAYSLAVLGFWLGAYLSLGQLAGLALGRPAPLAAHLDWYLLLAFTLITSLALGNLYCGRLCPFGALQEILGRAAAKTGVKPWRQAGIRNAAVLRWAYLWITLLVAFSLGMVDAVNYEPFATAFDRKGSLLTVVFLGVVLLGSIFVPRFWCRFFCPVGVILGKGPKKSLRAK